MQSESISGIWFYKDKHYTENFFLVESEKDKILLPNSSWYSQNDSLFVHFNHYDDILMYKFAKTISKDTLIIDNKIYFRMQKFNFSNSIDSVQIWNENYTIKLKKNQSYYLMNYKINESGDWHSYTLSKEDTKFIKMILESFNLVEIQKIYTDENFIRGLGIKPFYYKIYQNDKIYETTITSSKNAHELEILRDFLGSIIFHKHRNDDGFLENFFKIEGNC